MAICLRCHKKSTLFHSLNLDENGFCPECAEEYRREREAEAKKRREAAAAQRAADEARMERIRQEEAAQRQLLAQKRAEALEMERRKKPFDPPKKRGDLSLGRGYPDVGIYCPGDMLEAAKAVPPHAELSFRREPENTYDPDALLVVHGDTPIGYMNKGKLRDWVYEVLGDKNHDQDVLAVSCYWEDKPIIGLYFYRNNRYLALRLTRRDNFKKYTLSGNSGDDMQLNILHSEVGDTIEIDYDPELERYVALVEGLPIGCFPTSAEDYLSSYTGFEAAILDITERDSGLYAVSVIVAPE